METSKNYYDSVMHDGMYARGRRHPHNNKVAAAPAHNRHGDDHDENKLRTMQEKLHSEFYNRIMNALSVIKKQ